MNRAELGTWIVDADELADTRAGDRSKTAQLIVLTGPNAGERLVMEDDVVLGRDPAVDLPFGGETTVSRRHARINRLPDGTWELEDLGSANGTSINGRSTRTSALRFGDKIRLGRNVVIMFGRHDPLEDQLLQAQRLQLVGELAARVAHDVNNVLGSILANASTAEEADLSPEELRACLRDVQAATRRGAALAKQLTTFASPPRERTAIADLKTAIHEVHALLRRTAPGSIEMTVDLEQNVAVGCHPSALVQLLLNLGMNAVAAMPDGGRLSIRASVLNPDASGVNGRPFDSGCVRISVEDTGTGIDEGLLDRIFEPFFTTKPLGQGTGLGLATVERIASDHSGFVDVDSLPGRGTRFDVYLPVAGPGQERKGEPVHRAESLTGNVLVVDDDPLVRDALVRVLTRRGLMATTAGTASEAYAAYQDAKGRIDVVVLDLDLPGAPGEQVCRELHGLDPDVCVLIASGSVDPDRVDGLDQFGAKAYLQKPFDSRQLTTTIAGLLGGRDRVH